jgi:hypothetical protein
MSESNIPIQITLVDRELSEAELQQATQNLQAEIENVDGVETVDFIPVDQAEPGAKSIGGFITGVLKAEVSLKNLKKLVGYLGDRTFGRTIKIKAEGNGRSLDIEVRRPEDVGVILPEVDKFLKG